MIWAALVLGLASADLLFVPDPSALITSSDPTQLIAEETVTASDGIFSLALPSDHHGSIHISAPDAGSLRLPVTPNDPVAEMAFGTIELREAARLTVRVIDDGSCSLSAAGPLGTLGLTIVNATNAQNVHWFDIPEPGDWSLNAACQGAPRTLDPSVVSVGAPGTAFAVDVRLAKRPGKP